MNDYTGAEAQDRVLLLNFGFFRYGTSDKAHGASIVLSLFLLLVIAIVFVGGMFAKDAEWPKAVLGFLGPAFTLVAGVAIGQGSAKAAKNADEATDER